MASAVTTVGGGLEAGVCTELHVCRGESARIPSPPRKTEQQNKDNFSWVSGQKRKTPSSCHINQYLLSGVMAAQKEKLSRLAADKQ